MQLFLHSPPMSFMVIALVIALVSLVMIALGIILLVRHASELNTSGKYVFLLIPVILLATSPFLGYYATFPFGIFGGGALVLVFFGPGDDHWYYLVGGCLLNALGIYGVMFLFKRKLGVGAS